MEWLKKCLKVLEENKSTFIKFLTITGMRRREAIKSFNLIIKLAQEERIEEYL